MKEFLVALSLLISSAMSGNAAVVKGVCINQDGNPVEYVNIYMPKQSIGVIADNKGGFTINLPDDLQDSVIFSHISFETVSYAQDELVGKYTSAQKSGDELKIVLKERVYTLSPIIVTANAPKYVNLNSIGTKQPKRNITFGFKYKGFDNIGQVVKLKRKSRISNLEFILSKNTFDSLAIRVLLYKVDGKIIAPMTLVVPRDPLPTLIPLTNTPYYLYPKKSDTSQVLTCKFSDEDIVADGEVYIRIELVHGDKDGIMYFPAYDDSFKYFIDMQVNRWERYQYGIGLQLKGTVIK